MVGWLKFNIIEKIPFMVYLEIQCITFKKEKSFIAHPWIQRSVVGLEGYSAHDWRAADPGQNGHTPKRPHPKRPQLFWLPKRPQPKRPHCIGQNGHTGRITTKTAKLHLVKTATQGGSLPKRPHCIWSKRPQREDHYQNAFGQNGHKGRITTKTATQYNCGVAVLVATCVHSRHTN